MLNEKEKLETEILKSSPNAQTKEALLEMKARIQGERYQAYQDYIRVLAQQSEEANKVWIEAETLGDTWRSLLGKYQKETYREDTPWNIVVDVYHERDVYKRQHQKYRLHLRRYRLYRQVQKHTMEQT